MKTYPTTRNPWLQTIRRSTAPICGLLLMLGLAAPLPLSAASNMPPTDNQIKAAVEAGMRFDSSVPADTLDVTFADGIATLSGTAPNILAKERATTIAEAVRGVHAVINQVSVKPVSRTDEEIRKDVMAALKADPATAHYQIRPDVNDGIVTLVGTVHSWQESHLASAVTKGVKGVKGILYSISVDDQKTRPDSEILVEVTEILKRDVWVNNQFITTTVKNGVVTLAGTVGSAAAKTRAQLNAWTAGVKQVDDSALNVKPWAKHDYMKPTELAAGPVEGRIRTDLIKALQSDPRVRAVNPAITVDGHAVTLSGTVDNLKAKRAAEQDAWNTAGVWQVINRLTVSPQNPPSDDKLVRDVKDAIARDPYLDRRQVDVSATNGMVHLSGTVDSFYEKSHADDVTSRVNGVTGMDNNLVVALPASRYYYWPYSWSYYEPHSYREQETLSSSPLVSDAETKDAILARMRWSPFVDTARVQVAVTSGVATLTGTVDSWRASEAATESAYEGGARSVINNLKVR